MLRRCIVRKVVHETEKADALHPSRVRTAFGHSPQPVRDCFLDFITLWARKFHVIDLIWGLIPRIDSSMSSGI